MKSGSSYSSIVNMANQGLKQYFLFSLLPPFLLCLGIVARAFHYFSGRSLWLDESALALNIINRPVSDLFLPLDYNQGAPVGFLTIEKLMVNLFGNNEYALRLFPFIAGIIGLFCFYKLTKNYLKPNVFLIAIGLFSINKYLIYYSSEVKQYSSDVALTVIIFLVTFFVKANDPTMLNVVLLAMVGAIAIWFSHPAAFILAGIAVVLLISSTKNKDIQSFKRDSLVILIWTISFISCYIVSLRDLSNNEALLNFWKFSFVPFPPKSFSDIHWLFMSPFNFMKNPGGLSLAGLAVLAFIVGCSVLFKENKAMLLIIGSPIIVTIIASALHKYPIYGRLCLFLTPSLVIIVAEGAESIGSITYKYSKVIGVTLLALLFINPSLSVIYNIVKPPLAGMKPLLQYIEAHRKQNDKIYIQADGKLPFEYYRQQMGLTAKDFLVGETEPVKFNKDLEKLISLKRVWIVLVDDNDCDETIMLNSLDKLGRRIDSYKVIGSDSMMVSKDWAKAATYLYDFN